MTAGNSDCPTFAQLSTGGQLLAWTIRHLVDVSNHRGSMAPMVQRTFDMVGSPGIPILIHEWLSTIAAAAKRPVLVNVVNGVKLLDDERRLVGSVGNLQRNRHRAASSSLSPIVRSDVMDLALNQASLLARLFAEKSLRCGFAASGNHSIVHPSSRHASVTLH